MYMGSHFGRGIRRKVVTLQTEYINCFENYIAFTPVFVIETSRSDIMPGVGWSGPEITAEAESACV